MEYRVIEWFQAMLKRHILPTQLTQYILIKGNINASTATLEKNTNTNTNININTSTNNNDTILSIETNNTTPTTTTTTTTTTQLSLDDLLSFNPPDTPSRRGNITDILGSSFNSTTATATTAASNKEMAKMKSAPSTDIPALLANIDWTNKTTRWYNALLTETGQYRGDLQVL